MLNIIGLILDIIGVLLVFVFAVPYSGMEIDKNDPRRINPFIRPSWWKYLKILGIILIVLGFCFQLWSNFISTGLL